MFEIVGTRLIAVQRPLPIAFYIGEPLAGVWKSGFVVLKKIVDVLVSTA